MIVIVSVVIGDGYQIADPTCDPHPPSPQKRPPFVVEAPTLLRTLWNAVCGSEPISDRTLG